MRIDKIYTRGGDTGETSLGDGTRVSKSHLRIHVLGDLDEANSVIGVALLHIDDAEVRKILSRAQNDLFDVGADLCRPEEDDGKTALRVSAYQVAVLEERIDYFNGDLQPLASFVLPGGSAAGAHMHHARAVLRRCERHMAGLIKTERVNPEALKYVNRLSDLLFVLARWLNAKGASDVVWVPGANR